jgi:ATP-dependent Clp protease adaptor protein ClpS
VAKVRVPSLVAAQAGGRKEFEVDAATVGEALRGLPVADLLLDEHGELRSLVNVYVDGVDARAAEGLETSVGAGTEVRVIAAIAGGETLTPPRERERSGTGSGLGDATNVVVLNDDHNTFEGVAFALAAVVPGVDYDRGMSLANRIHNTGRAVVWSGHREQAELYWAQLEGHGLTMAPLE